MDEYPTDFVTVGTVENVYTTHVTHQEQFFVHLDTRSGILEEVMEKLETRYSQLGPNDKTLPHVKLGGLCAAKFTDDNNWYRVKITGLLNNGLIEVNFVDYGNTDYVSGDRVKRLDPDLMQYPVQSYKCALAGVSCQYDLWPPELRVQFEDLVVDKPCKAVFTGKAEEDIYLLDMYDEQGTYINKLFGAAEKSNAAVAGKSHRNGSHTVQGFDSVVWTEGQKVQALVVYVKTPDVFWCQEVVHTNDIFILSEELSRLHMTQGMSPLQDFRPGAICAAKFHEDQNWYRGIIQSISRNQAQVYFVDYGNTETVGVESICELKPEFRKLAALAVKCSLHATDGTKSCPEATEEFEKLVVDKEFELSVMRKSHDGYEVYLLDIEENRDVGNQLKQILSRGGIKARTPPKEASVNNNNNSQSPSANRGLDLAVGSTANVFLSWIDNPVDFWVQLEQASEIIDKLSSELQEYYNQPRPAALSAPGAFVIARFSEDQQWYRGLVVKEFDDLVKVLFIDYGNADTIPKSELRQVNPQFGQVDPLAFRCCLKGIKPLPQDNTWSVDAKDFLEKMTENGCQCEVISKNDAYRFINLKVDGKDVTQELVSLAVVAGSQPTPTKPNVQGYLPNPRLNENQTEQVTVTHIDSPHSFWIQLNKNHPQLDAVMEKLDNHYSEDGGTPVSRPTIGLPCVAQYSLDNAWYRAIVSNIASSGCDVHFVDYGNREVVVPIQMCVAEPRFLDLPCQAIKCSLPLPGDVSNLTDALSDLVLEKDVTLTVLSVGSGIPTVDLVVEGQSICGVLRNQGGSGNIKSQSGGSSAPTLKPAKSIPQGSTVQAFTSMVHNPGRFFLQVSGVDEELAVLMDQLATQYVPQGVPVVSKLSVGMFCVALYEDDNQWYRGKITAVHADQCQVLFVDYGNEEFVNNSLVKVLTPEVSNPPIYAYECSLHGVQANEWSDASIESFESTVMDQELSCTFINQSAVKISCNGEDVAAKLILAGHCQSSVGPGPKSPLSVSTSQSGLGASRSSKSPGFGQSPRKDENNSGSFGRREDRGFGGGRENNSFGEEKKGFGGGRENNSFGEEKKGFGGGRKDDGGGRQEGRGFGGGGEGREERGGRRFGGGGDDGESGGFGTKRGGGDGGSGFGGGRRERKSSDSSTTTPDKFTYADPPSEPGSAILVHIDDDGTFYLQLPSMEKDIVFLSKRLAGSYKSGGPRLKGIAEKGTTCCCKFPGDGSMYRCQVEAIDGDKVLVRYMDFGNTVEHTTFDLKFLFPDLLQYSVQAFPCKLRGLDWSLEKADMFGTATLDKDLEVTFTTTTAPYLVDIKTPDGDLLSIMTGKIAPPVAKVSSPISKTSPNQGGGAGFGAKGFGSRGGSDASSPKKISSSPAKPSVPKQVFKSQTAPSESQTAFISHISEDGYFYLQLEKDTGLLESLTEKLTSLDSSTPHPDLSKGAACAAVFSEDSSWYRAVISEVNGDQFNATFVDFGNGDKVSKENIRPLNADLLSAAPLAYQCTFAGETEALSDQAKEKLQEYLLEHPITVSFSSHSTPFAVKAITTDGQDLYDIVCPSNQFRSHSIPNDVQPVGVSYIEEDGRFFVCFYKQYKAKDKLHNKLQKHYSSSEVESLENAEVDNPCCYKSLSDDQWYRCKIKSITDSQVEVQYVDNGKCDSAEINDLKALPSEFLKDVPFALDCRLKGVESWTDDLKEKFIDMTEGKILNATFYTTSVPYRVSLARSIELDLLGLSAPEPDSPRKKLDDSVIASVNLNRSEVFQGGDSFITETTTQGIFYVQLVSEEDQLQNLSDNLDALLNAEQSEPDNIDVGSILAARFTEDDVWYRATVEEKEDDKITVRFIDYGNTDTVGKDRLADLPDELSATSVQAFAYRCKLSTPTSQIVAFKAAVLDKMVSIEVISTEDDGVFNVNVTLDGQPLALDQETGVSEGSEVFQGGDSFITETTTQGIFYVQLVAQEEQLQNLSDNLDALLNAEQSEPDNIDVGSILAARFTEDDVWYRATVEEKEDDKFTVRFIDYGNTDTVGKDRLAALPEALSATSVQAFAYKCKLSTPTSELEEFKAAVLEKKVAIKVVCTEDDGVFNVNVTVDGQTFGLNQETDGVLEEKIVEEQEAKSGSSASSESERKTVTVAFVVSPSQFCVQLQAKEGQLDSMMNELYEEITGLAEGEGLVPDDIAVGDLCAALYEESWYRVRIVSFGDEDQSVQVLYVDHGNSETVSDRSELRAMPDKFKALPLFGHEASLPGIKPVDGNWTEEAIEAFRELVEEKSLLADLIECNDDKPWVVQLLDMGTPVQDTLIAKGHGMVTESIVINKATKRVFSEIEDSILIEEDAVPVDWKKRIGCILSKVEELKEVKAFVSHVDDPYKVWCQLASSTEDLEQLADKIEMLYSSKQDSDKIVGDVKLGDLVIGLFEEDGVCYRSEVIKAYSDKVLLRFIDYGNVGLCEKDQIMKVREELYEQPSLAFCCSLAKIQSFEETWCQSISERVTELTTDQELLLTLVGRKQDGTALIDLIFPEMVKSLSSMLLEEGLVKSLDIDTSMPVLKNESEKGDVSECLEITQPIMESTAMVEEASSSSFADYSFGWGDDGYYRCIELTLHSSCNIKVIIDEMPNVCCVQLKELKGQLDDLMEKIQKHVSTQPENDYSPRIGDPCLVKLDRWCRGLLRKENNDGTFAVYSVDEGWQSSKNPECIRKIPTEFLDLPGQAIHVYLAGVVSSEDEWSSEAISYFKEYLKENDVHINVMEHADDKKYGVSMQDSSLDYTGVSLNQLMVDLGYAVMVPGSNIEVQYLMEKTLDTDMLDELEDSFKEVEEIKVKASVETDASSSQFSTFATSQEEERLRCKALPEGGSKFYQLVHLSKSEMEGQSITDKTEMTQDEKNSVDIALTRKDMKFNIASAVDRIDQMGCIDLFPEDSLPFYLTSDAESLLDASKDISLNVKEESQMKSESNDVKVVEASDETPTKQLGSEETAFKGDSNLPLYTWSQPASPESEVSSKDGKKDDSGDSADSQDKLPISSCDVDGTGDGHIVNTVEQLEMASVCLEKVESDGQNNATVNIDEGFNIKKPEISLNTQEEITFDAKCESEHFEALNIVEEEMQLSLPNECYEVLEKKENSVALENVTCPASLNNTSQCDTVESKGHLDVELKNAEIRNDEDGNHYITLDQAGFDDSDIEDDLINDDNILANPKVSIGSENVNKDSLAVKTMDIGDVDGGSVRSYIIIDQTGSNDKDDISAIEKKSGLETKQDLCESDDEKLDSCGFEDDDSYLTIDQTGYTDDSDVKRGDLTDGYHDSASDEVSSPGTDKLDHNEGLEKVDSGEIVSCTLKLKDEVSNDILKEEDHVQDDDVNVKDDLVGVGDEDDASDGIVNVMSYEDGKVFSKDVESSNLEMRKSEDESNETLGIEQCEEDDKVSCCSDISSLGDSKYIDPNEQLGLDEDERNEIDEDGVEDGINDVQESEEMNKSVVEINAFAIEQDNVGYGIYDNCANNCQSGTESELENVTDKASYRNVDMKNERLDKKDGHELKDEGGSYEPNTGSSGNTSEGSMFESCLEPNLSRLDSAGSQEVLLAEDTTVEVEELSIQGKITPDSDDEEEDELVASLSTLNDTYDNYESASESFEDFDRTDSIHQSSEISSYLESSGLDNSCREADSSSYDTSSLVFSDSSFADTSASTQKTELSGWSFTDTSTTYNESSSSTFEDSNLTAGDETNSSLSEDSVNSMVNVTSNDQDQPGKIHNVSDENTESIIVVPEGYEKKGNSNEVEQLSNCDQEGNKSHVEDQNGHSSDYVTDDDAVLSTAVRQIPVNKIDDHKIKYDVKKDYDDIDYEGKEKRNEMECDEQMKQELPKETSSETELHVGEVVRNMPQQDKELMATEQTKEIDAVNGDVKSKVDSEQSGPPSFHSTAEDEEEEVISGNLQDSALAIGEEETGAKTEEEDDDEGKTQDDDNEDKDNLSDAEGTTEEPTSHTEEAEGHSAPEENEMLSSKEEDNDDKEVMGEVVKTNEESCDEEELTEESNNYDRKGKCQEDENDDDASDEKLKSKIEDVECEEIPQKEVEVVISSNKDDEEKVSQDKNESEA